MYSLVSTSRITITRISGTSIIIVTVLSGIDASSKRIASIISTSISIITFVS